MGVSRRSFLKLSGLTAAGSILGSMGSAGVALAKTERKGIPDAKNKAMMVDVSKCIGCASCVSACKKAHNLPEPYKNSKFTNGDNWTAVKFFKREAEQGKSANPALLKVKMQCMHCTEPSCVAVCPTGAAFKREEDGIVLIDDEVCIGCKNCVVACPYAIPGENEESKVVEKCTFCQERMKEGKPTNCSEACPAGAIVFGEREEIILQANARLGELKANGYPDANIYGIKELGGLRVVYVLPVKSEEAGLYKDVQVATGDVLLKWGMGILTAGALIVGPLRKVFGEDDKPVSVPRDKGVNAGD